MTCRICGEATSLLLDLGSMPPANRLKASRADTEQHYPLAVERCLSCFNLQLTYCVAEEELYSHYFYLTPDSPSLRAHYRFLTDHMFGEGYLSHDSFVFEIGSNVGRFLEHLKPLVGKVHGIDPAGNVCRMAVDNGIDTTCGFFNRETAAALERTHGAPDVIVARHCAAHNKDPHAIISGVAELLADDGYFLMENAYALNTLVNNEFDQIYHEHMFYYSIRSVVRLFALHGLRLIDVLQAPIHGGSIVFVAVKDGSKAAERPSVAVEAGREAAVLTEDLLKKFVDHVHVNRARLSDLINEILGRNQTIWAYGATAKGVTLMNYVGLDSRHISYCADSTPIKQGKYIPMANIEIRSEQDAFDAQPDYFLLTAWNYKEEVISKIRNSGNMTSRFILPIPTTQII